LICFFYKYFVNNYFYCIIKLGGEILKKLYKIEKGKKICGVCGGIAEYFNIDPTLVRLLAVFLVLWAGTGILAYILAAIIMPTKDEII